MAEKFKSLAQVLELGESTMNIHDIKNKMQEYKAYIERQLPNIERRPGWGEKEGELALNLINKILDGEMYTQEEIDRAIMDIKTNLRNINSNEFHNIIKSYNSLGKY